MTNRDRKDLGERVTALMDGFAVTALDVALHLGEPIYNVRSAMLRLRTHGMIEAVANRVGDGRQEVVWCLSNHGRFHSQTPKNGCKHCERTFAE